MLETENLIGGPTIWILASMHTVEGFIPARERAPEPAEPNPIDPTKPLGSLLKTSGTLNLQLRRINN